MLHVEGWFALGCEGQDLEGAHPAAKQAPASRMDVQTLQEGPSAHLMKIGL